MIPANLLLLERACQEIGVKEVPGTQHAPEILKYLELAGFDTLFNDDETPWCSTFMNAMCAVLCLERSGKPNARSWLEVGERTHAPKPGDVVVFWRGSQNSWKGHVGVFISKRNGLVYTLGGNQSNMVNVAPYSEDRVLGYRKLKVIPQQV